ncbi:unnamed protein product, partial [Ectocarpus fasciculatus]
HPSALHQYAAVQRFSCPEARVRQESLLGGGGGVRPGRRLRPGKAFCVSKPPPSLLLLLLLLLL